MREEHAEAVLCLYRIVTEQGNLQLSREQLRRHGLLEYLDFFIKQRIIKEEKIREGFLAGSKVLGKSPEDDIINIEQVGSLQVNLKHLEEKILEILLPKEKLETQHKKIGAGISVFHVKTSKTSFYTCLLRKHLSCEEALEYILNKTNEKPVLILYTPSEKHFLLLRLLFEKTIAGLYITVFAISSSQKELEWTRKRVEAFLSKAKPLEEHLYKYAEELEKIYEPMRNLASIVKYNPLILARLLLELEYSFSKSRLQDIGLPINQSGKTRIHTLAEYAVALTLAYMYHPNVYLDRIGGKNHPDVFLKRKDNEEIIIVDTKCYENPRKLPYNIKKELEKELREKRYKKSKNPKYFRYIEVAKEKFNLKNKRTTNTLAFVTSKPVNEKTAIKICDVIKQYNTEKTKFDRVILLSLRDLRTHLEQLFVLQEQRSTDIFSKENLEPLDNTSFCYRTKLVRLA